MFKFEVSNLNTITKVVRTHCNFFLHFLHFCQHFLNQKQKIRFEKKTFLFAHQDKKEHSNYNKYFQIFGAQFTGAGGGGGGKAETLEMGCYGIGVSRILAAAVEVRNLSLIKLCNMKTTFKKSYLYLFIIILIINLYGRRGSMYTVQCTALGWLN